MDKYNLKSTRQFDRGLKAGCSRAAFHVEKSAREQHAFRPQPNSPEDINLRDIVCENPYSLTNG